MAKKSTHKIGVVSVRETGPRAWQLRWTDPHTGRDVKRKLAGMDLGEVRRIAAHVSQESLADKGYLPGRGSGVPTLRDGLAESIKASAQRPHVKKESARSASGFLKWITARYPRVERWDQLKPSMLEAYTRECEAAGLSYFTIRNRLATIKQAWRFVHRDYPDSISPVPSVRQVEAPPKDLDCLNPSEVSALLEWLQTHEPGLYTMATLQALCGLRVLEVCALRRGDVDLSRGTVTVASTQTHVPKTASSYRTLPVCGEALAALASWIQDRAVVPIGTAELFLHGAGGVWTKDSIVRKWRRTLPRAAKALGIPRIMAVPIHRLRSSFATMAAALGLPDALIRRYMGHTAKAGDVLNLHYRVLSEADLRVISDRMSTWRTLIGGIETGTIPESLRDGTA